MKIHTMYRAAQHHKSLDADIKPLVDAGGIVVVYASGDGQLVSYTSVYAPSKVLVDIRSKTGWAWITYRVFGMVHLNTEYGNGAPDIQRLYPDAVVVDRDDSLDLEADQEYDPGFLDDGGELSRLEDGMELFVEEEETHGGK